MPVSGGRNIWVSLDRSPGDRWSFKYLSSIAEAFREMEPAANVLVQGREVLVDDPSPGAERAHRLAVVQKIDGSLPDWDPIGLAALLRPPAIQHLKDRSEKIVASKRQK